MMVNSSNKKNQIDLSLISLWRPISWKIVKVSKNYMNDSDTIYRMQVGNYNDDEPIYVYISESNYNLLLTGKANHKYYVLNNFIYLYLVNGNNQRKAPVLGTHLGEVDCKAIEETDTRILKLTEKKIK